MFAYEITQFIFLCTIQNNQTNTIICTSWDEHLQKGRRLSWCDEEQGVRHAAKYGVQAEMSASFSSPPPQPCGLWYISQAAVPLLTGCVSLLFFSCLQFRRSLCSRAAPVIMNKSFNFILPFLLSSFFVERTSVSLCPHFPRVPFPVDTTAAATLTVTAKTISTRAESHPQLGQRSRLRGKRTILDER